MSATTCRDYLKDWAMRIERGLTDQLPAEWRIPDSLRSSMTYSLLGGGKRLRPVLAVAACEAMDGDPAQALPAAYAVEFIHTYSLIHDDLPAMDDDDYRRGRLTNHKVYGEAMAILAGDALLTHAFHVLAARGRAAGLPAETLIALTEELARLAGAAGMVGGQARDVEGEQGVTTLEELEDIHLRKTGDLFVFALRAGGRIGGAGEAQLAGLERFGRSIGLAFQIRDDLLDIIGDEQVTGKKTNMDESRQKVTYPYFLGVEASKHKVAELTAQGLEAVTSGPGALPKPERLIQIARYLTERDR